MLKFTYLKPYTFIENKETCRLCCSFQTQIKNLYRYHGNMSSLLGEVNHYRYPGNMSSLLGEVNNYRYPGYMSSLLGEVNNYRYPGNMSSLLGEVNNYTVGAESMAHAESMARRRFAANTAAPVHFLKDFFS